MRSHRYLGLLFTVMVLGTVCAVDAAQSFQVGYRVIDVADPLAAKPFPTAVWYPTHTKATTVRITSGLAPCRLPDMLCSLLGAFSMEVAQEAPVAEGRFGIVVISHGAGGTSLGHRNLATTLASAGYVVAAPTHPRGNHEDISGPSVWIGRPKQVSAVIDRLLNDSELGQRIAPERIGVAGHSNGGYTALAVVGGQPSIKALARHCGRMPQDTRFCSYGGARTREGTQETGDIPNVHDSRVRAAVLMAPNGAPFTDEGLSKVAVPVRIYGAEHDDLTPPQFHAARLASAMPSRATYRLIKGADHFSFIESFPTMLKVWVGEPARDPKGFDRDAMHEALNRDILAFFEVWLKDARDSLTSSSRRTP